MKGGVRVHEIRSADRFEDAELSSDGARILTRDPGGNQARIWDAASGERLCELKGHVARLVSAAFTGNPESVVTTSEDRTWRVWDAATCELRRTVATNGSIFRASTSADGRYLATWNHLGKGSVWEIATSALVSTHDFSGIMPDASFSPDGEALVTCGADFKTRLGYARVWDAATGQPRMTLPAESGEGFYSCEFDKEGTRILTSSGEGIARVWDAARGGPLVTVRHGPEIRSARFSPDGRHVVTTGLDSAVKVWDAHGGVLVGSYVGGRGMAIAFSADATHIAMTDDRGTVTIRRTRSGRLRQHFDKPEEDRWTGHGRDGERLVTRGPDGLLKLWDTVSGRRLPHDAIHSPVVFSTDGSRLAAAAGEDRVLILDAATGSTVLSLPRKASAVRRLQLSGDGHRMLIVSEGESPRVWDSATGKLLFAMDDMATAGSLDDSGKRVLAWNDEQRAYIWDVDTRQIVSTLELLEGHEGFQGWESLWGQFMHDGSYVYLNENHRHRFGVFETATGRRLLTDPLATSISIDRAGETMATFGTDGVARLWRVADGSSVAQFSFGSRLEPISGALSPDGAFLVVLGARETSLWSALDGRLLAQFPMRRNLFQWRHRLYFVDIGLEDPTRDAAEGLGLPTFARDGGTILTLESAYRARRNEATFDPFLESDGFAEWTVALEDRTPKEISGIVEKNARWRVVGSRLVGVGTLRGRVMQRGRSVADALVTVSDANSRDSRTVRYEDLTTVAASDGRFIIRDLNPGPYDVHAFVRDGASAPTTRVWLEPGETIDLDVDLTSAGVISGVVVDPTGQPLAGVQVEFSCPNGIAAPAITTAADGTFGIPRLKGGCEYEARVKRSNQSGGEELPPVNGTPVKLYVKDDRSHVADVRLVVGPAP